MAKPFMLRALAAFFHACSVMLEANSVAATLRRLGFTIFVLDLAVAPFLPFSRVLRGLFISFVTFGHVKAIRLIQRTIAHPVKFVNYF